MRYSLLSILKSSKEYVSGEFISKNLGVTRASVWKHIKALKEEGYIIEGVQNKGYKLISSPKTFSKLEIQSTLKTAFIGKELYFYEDIDSTNIQAKKLVKKQASNGALIISKKQSLGKGRFERNWASPEGGLWFSIILKPLIDPNTASKITLIVAEAIFKSLKKLNLNAKIKWPNDILINDKKICGILTEMKADMDKVNYIVVGIGLNSNISYDSFPLDLRNTATSILIEQGFNIDNTNLLNLILENFENSYSHYIKTLDFSKTLSTIKESSTVIGKYLYVKTIRENFKAKCLDIDNDGNLILQKEDGSIITQYSGEISTKKLAD